MVLSRNLMECLLRVGNESLLQVKEVKLAYLGVLFTREGTMEWEIGQRIGAAVLNSLYRNVYCNFVPTLTYGHEDLVKRTRSPVQAADWVFSGGWLLSPLEIG